MSDWITIDGESSLPENPATVLGYNPQWGDDTIWIVYFDGEEWLEADGIYPLELAAPTHWMHLPAAPVQ